MKYQLFATYTSLILISVLMSGCATPPETRLDNPAFSVTVPEGWKAGKVKEPKESGGFRKLVMQKKGGFFNPSLAMVTIFWYDEILDLESTIAERMKNIEDDRFLKPEFGEVTDGSYGQYEGLMARSDFKKWKLGMQIEMYCFHASGKTFVIWTGDDVESLAKNLQGFQLIEGSFSVQ